LIIQPGMKIGIKKAHKVWRAYSRGNRVLDVPVNGYRLVLYDASQKEILQLQKVSSLDVAKLNQNELNKQLGIKVIREK